MKFLRFTLLTEGSSDQALIPHLLWLLKQNGVTLPILHEWANDGLSRLREKPQNLAERIDRSVELYPCDLLFVHRDADREGLEKREDEINEALTKTKVKGFVPICVIPVRMTEAWMLFDESAIKRASGNPNGRENLVLPKIKTVEAEPDPKKILHDLLKKASERTGRRLQNFHVGHHSLLVSENIQDFSLLRQLPAFVKLEHNIIEALKLIDALDK